MSDPTFFDFIDVLADTGLLRRVSHDVASRFELAEFTRQLRGGQSDTPAVLFDRVNGSTLSAVASAYSTEAAIAKAFRVEEFEELPGRISQWLRPRGGRGVRDVLAMLPSLTRAIAWGDSGRKARCQQVVRLGKDVNLTTLPFPHCWPAESGPSITTGLLITRDADNEQTVETAIAEVYDSQHVRIRFHEHSPALDAWNRSRANGRQLDIAIALGGPPALWPTVWLSEIVGIDSTVLGEVLGQPQPETVRGRTVTATVPASCELILEGRLDPEHGPCEPGRLTTEWGRVASTGTWTTASIHAVTHAAAAALPATILHPGNHDLTVLNRLAERCLEQVVCSLVPGVAGLRTPIWGAPRQTALIAIESSRVARAAEIASAVRGLHGLSQAKLIVLLDENVDLNSSDDVLASIIESASPRRDIRIVDTMRNADDPSAGEIGSAVIIDATTAVAPQPMRRALPSPATAEAVRNKLTGQ